LGLLLAGVLMADLIPAWRLTDQVRRHHILNSASSALGEAAGALAVERGLTDGVLVAPAASTPAIQAKISEYRTKANAALVGGLVLAPGGTGAPVAEPPGRLDGLRRDAQTGLVTPAAWFAGATAAIDAVVARRRQIEAQVTGQGAVAALITVRDQLGEMSEFAGRLRSSVDGLISRGGHVSGPEAQSMRVLQGWIDGAWTAIAARMDNFPDAVWQSIETAGVTWRNGFGPLRRSVMEASAQGRDWMVSAGDWLRRASTAIDAMLAAQASSGAALDQALEVERIGAQNAVLIAAAGLATSALLVAGMIWFVRRRVVAPLREVIGVINRLAANDLEAEQPLMRGSDEIGELCVATARFRNTARQVRAISEKQAALADRAERPRAEAIRE
jgi:hypothetical protein